MTPSSSRSLPCQNGHHCSVAVPPFEAFPTSSSTLEPMSHCSFPLHRSNRPGAPKICSTVFVFDAPGRSPRQSARSGITSASLWYFSIYHLRVLWPKLFLNINVAQLQLSSTKRRWRAPPASPTFSFVDRLLSMTCLRQLSSLQRWNPHNKNIGVFHKS
jgi:hypothetical protein